MKKKLMARRPFALSPIAGCAWAALLCAAPIAQASTGASADAAPPHPITAAQRSTAQAVAAVQPGVPLADLAAQAPERYTVKSGDTLWSISSLYLNEPWRWPELWGMNLAELPNPHRIFPGQQLFLVRTADGRAQLSTSTGDGVRLSEAGVAPSTQDIPTVRLSPMVRSQKLSELAVPTVQMHLIEPFLTEPLVMSSNELEHAARIVTAERSHNLMSTGDVIYAMGDERTPRPLDKAVAAQWRILHKATPLHDPATGEVLGWEAHYVGRAELLQSQPGVGSSRNGLNSAAAVVPAQLRITRVREEITPGDRLLPEPERQFNNFVPHAPAMAVDAQVVKLYGAAGALQAGENQVISFNRGQRDGITPGMVLSLITAGRVVSDRSDGGQNRMVQLPQSTNGYAIVFRTFERVSYALILEAQRDVKVGDRLVKP